jgi:hypothetical protein
VWQANVTTVPVTYGGSTPLLPDSDYAWVVRWWDSSGGEASSWSNVSMFSTGHTPHHSHTSLASLHGKRWEARLAPHVPVSSGKRVLVLRQQDIFVCFNKPCERSSRCGWYPYHHTHSSVHTHTFKRGATTH